MSCFQRGKMSALNAGLFGIHFSNHIGGKSSDDCDRENGKESKDNSMQHKNSFLFAFFSGISDFLLITPIDARGFGRQIISTPTNV